MVNIVLQSLLITLSFVAIFIIFGLIFEKINHLTENNLRNTFGNKHFLLTGIIGTPIHEFSHLLMCLIFRHKVTEVELFRPIKCQSDGVLGYVNHSYNTKSTYQKIGNFFIGIAPIVFGITILTLSLWFLLPMTFEMIVNQIDVKNYFQLFYANQFNQIFSLLTIDIMFVIKTLFSIENLTQPQFWIYFLLMFSIVTHMTLSKADLEGCAAGIFSFFMLTVVFVLTCNIFKINYTFMINYIVIFNIIVLLFMLLGLFFNLICCILSFCLRKILLK